MDCLICQGFNTQISGQQGRTGWVMADDRTALSAFAAREQERSRAEDAAVERVIYDLGAFHRQYGLLSGEFSPL